MAKFTAQNSFKQIRDLFSQASVWYDVIDENEFSIVGALEDTRITFTTEHMTISSSKWRGSVAGSVYHHTAQYPLRDIIEVDVKELAIAAYASPSIKKEKRYYCEVSITGPTWAVGLLCTRKLQEEASDV